MLYTVGSMPKRSTISIVYMASSMRSAKPSSGFTPRQNDKKAARKGGFFLSCRADEKRTKIDLCILWRSDIWVMRQRQASGSVSAEVGRQLRRMPFVFMNSVQSKLWIFLRRARTFRSGIKELVSLNWEKTLVFGVFKLPPKTCP